MTWLDKYLQDKHFYGKRSLLEKRLMFFMCLLLAIGLMIATLQLVYRELFRSDLSNPVAETAQIVMFAVAFFMVARNRMEQAVFIVFFIPVVILLQYLSGFSNTASPVETIHYSFLWLSGGLVFLALFSPFGFHYFAFFVSGFLTLIYHHYKARIPALNIPDAHNFISNPYFLFTAVFTAVALIRKTLDDRLSEINLLLTQREQQWYELFQEVKSPMASIKAVRDQDGNIIRMELERINHAFESEFGISLRQAKNQELNYILNLAFRDEINWNDLMIINPKEMKEVYSPVSDHWLNLHIHWINRDDCLAFFYDISREKKLIGELQQSKSRYLTLLEAIPDIFFMIDRDGIYQDVVFKGQEKLYPETSEIIGNTIFNVGFQDNMAMKIFDCIRKAIKNDTIETIEYTLNTRETSLFFEMRIARLDETSVISIARDITRRKRAEFELEKAKTKAEEAVELKSRFLANLSHDIRTPMNAILGFSKILTEPDLSDYEKEDYVQEIQLQGNILMKMIENTIQLSKIETNTLDVNFSYTNINQLLREVYNHFYPQLPGNRDIRLKMSVGIHAENAGFETDSNLLKEVLHRLVDNAIKFTTEGTIHFGYSGVNGKMVEFFVEDTGPGIAESERENVFLRFYVIESDRKANRSGPGLGLSIAQHFVALLGGELMLDSIPGKGSRFWFRIPLKNPSGFMQLIDNPRG